MGDLQGAMAAAQTALVGPNDIEALDVLGMIAHDRLNLAAAEDYFRRAIEKAPSFAEAHFHLSLCLLLRGEYGEGWTEFAWRTRIEGPANFVNYDFGIPRWTGQSVAGSRVLLHAEQGHGDTIQFVRFAESLAGEGAQVDLFCHDPLVSLLGRVPGIRSATSNLSERPTHHFHAPIGDLLPRYLPTPESVHWRHPYLSPKVDVRAKWDAALEALPRPRVGIVWRGNPLHINDRNRSVPESEIRQLLSDRVAFINLQVPTSPLDERNVTDIGHLIHSWEDTCAIVSQLDLVLTVDTAVAHLAGASGKRVCVLIPYCPDWRWRLDGAQTPWYPSMQLFRQTTPGDWSSVLNRVRQEVIASL